MSQEYVQRLTGKITRGWIEACVNMGKDPSDIFMVIHRATYGYQLEGINGFWDFNAFEVVSPNAEQTPENLSKTKDVINNPSHYDMMGANTIEILACAMTQAEWRGFCLGNTLKYRIRAGKKDNLQQDIDKANNYETLYEKHKHLCRKE